MRYPIPPRASETGVLPPQNDSVSILPRPRLFSLLTEPTPLVVVCGSRFTGKTSLVRSWLATDPVPSVTVIFVAAPHGHFTPTGYWRSVAAAAGVAPADCPDDDLSAVVSLRKRLTTAKQPVLLVLDALPPVDDIEGRVRDLISDSPQLRVIVTSRRSGEWRGLDEAHTTVIGPDELAFSSEETFACLRRRGVAHDLRWAQWITRRTGGLAGLVDAVCMGLVRETGTIAAPDGFITSAVDEEIAGVISGDTAFIEFGALISLAAAAAPLLPDVVAILPGVTDGLSLLRVFESLGVVEQPCSPAREWRYPEPVRESLLRTARSSQSRELRLARNAFVKFWLEHGRPHIALAIAIEGEDWREILDIVNGHWIALYTGGFLSTLDDALIERIPEEIARDHPTVAAIRRMHRRFAAPRDVPVIAASPVTPIEDDAGPAEAMMRMIALRVDLEFEEATALCDGLASAPVPNLDELDERPRHAYAFMYLHIGITYQLVDRLDEATAMFRRAHRAGAGMFVERDAAGKLSLAYAACGACPDAAWWLDQEQRHPPLPEESERLVRTAGMVAAVFVALDRLELDTALAVLTELGSPADREEYWAFVLCAVGRHALLAGAPADGLRSIEHHLERYSGVHREGSVARPMLDAARADLNLAIGRIGSARALVARSTHPRTASARARIHLFARESGSAEQLADQYWGDIRCSVRDSLELSLIGAAAADENGNREGALRHLNRAVALSRQHGLLSPFTLLEASALRRLTSYNVDIPIDVDRVVNEFPVFRERVSVVRLTKQERVILTALASGGTITEIARMHYVSANTVKTHVRSLYRKLGVHSRKEAIIHARRIGLDVPLDRRHGMDEGRPDRRTRR